VKARLLGLFQTDVARRITELGGALASGDLKSSATIAHTVKGSAGSIGAKRLSTLCGMIETAARATADNRGLILSAEPIGLALVTEYAAADDALRIRLGSS